MAKGVDILILVRTGGTDQDPVFTVVGGQRGATLSESVETIEITHKASTGKEYDYGWSDWTISCDGVYIEDDAGYAALVSAMRNKQQVQVRWSEGGASKLEGMALVTSRDLDGPYDGEATYSVELQGTGAPTPAV